MKQMNESAVRFAIRNHLTLGRFETRGGYYYLKTKVNDRYMITHCSMYPTARSAMVMMKKHLKR